MRHGIVGTAICSTQGVVNPLLESFKHLSVNVLEKQMFPGTDIAGQMSAVNEMVEREKSCERNTRSSQRSGQSPNDSDISHCLAR
jgi:hypothetical protein